MITGSQLYDYCGCPQRVFLDIYGNPAERDEPNAFVELLWEHGLAYEADVVATLGVTADVSKLPDKQREAETLAAMARGEPLIYGGRIVAGDLLGIPDLLALRGGKYIAGDIKSGGGLDGDDGDGGGKLKKTYAFQVAHYTNILEHMGWSDDNREAFILDGHGSRVPYLLAAPQGVRNTAIWWHDYEAALAEVRLLVGGNPSRAALAASCKLCHWHSRCKKELIAASDLTLIADLGRARRDVMAGTLATVADLATCRPDAFLTAKGKKTIFPSIGPDTLVKFHQRAKLLVTPGAKPYIKSPIYLPICEKEVYFDIEADPMRDIVYLHGFVERQHGQPATAVFRPFYAAGFSAADEQAAFAGA